MGQSVICFCYFYDDTGCEVGIDFCHADGTTYGYDELIYDENSKQSGFYCMIRTGTWTDTRNTKYACKYGSISEE